METKVRVMFEIDVVGKLNPGEVNALLRPASESFCAAVSPLGKARMKPVEIEDERSCNCGAWPGNPARPEQKHASSCPQYEPVEKP